MIAASRVPAKLFTESADGPLASADDPLDERSGAGCGCALAVLDRRRLRRNGFFATVTPHKASEEGLLRAYICALPGTLSAMSWWEHLFHPSLWDWGDVGTWVQGIATVATFILGFRILLSDRRRQERQQAARVAILHRQLSEADPKAWSISVDNHSDLPIYHPKAYNPTMPESDLPWLSNDPESIRGIVMPPGGSGWFEGYNAQPPLDDWFVMFQDSARVDWIYDPKNRNLRKLKRGRSGYLKLPRR